MAELGVAPAADVEVHGMASFVSALINRLDVGGTREHQQQQQQQQHRLQQQLRWHSASAAPICCRLASADRTNGD